MGDSEFLVHEVTSGTIYLLYMETIRRSKTWIRPVAVEVKNKWNWSNLVGESDCLDLTRLRGHPARNLLNGSIKIEESFYDVLIRTWKTAGGNLKGTRT